MCAFRRVEGEQAGPTALGILVPPSRRTVVIVRPRTLEWDLVLSQASGAFREMNREEAEHLAHLVAAALEAWADGGSGRIETVFSLDAGRSWLRVCLGIYTLTVCARIPGQPYRPYLFAGPDAVRIAVDTLTALLRPAANVEQELYLNTRNFTRPD